MGLPPLICEAWVLLELLPTPHNKVPSPSSTPLPDCHFSSSRLGDVFLGNIAKTAAGIPHDNQDSAHSRKNRLRAGQRRLLFS